MDEPSGGKTCCICANKFSLTRLKHKCKICNRPVCSDDSYKKQFKGSNQRICHECDNNFIKEEVQQEIDKEVTRLKTDIQQLIKTNERLEREQFSKTSTVNKLEQQLRNCEREFAVKEKELQARLDEEVSLAHKVQTDIEGLQTAYEESCQRQKEIVPKVQETEEQIESYRRENAALDQRAKELKRKLDKINKRVTSSLALKHINKHLCQPCGEKVKLAYEARIIHPSLLDEESFVGRVSLMQNLEEINQRLEASPEPASCVLL